MSTHNYPWINKRITNTFQFTIIFKTKTYQYFCLISPQKYASTQWNHPGEIILVSTHNIYRTQPNYHTVRLNFFKITEQTYSKIHRIRAHFKEKSAEDFMRSVFNDAYAILFSDFLYKAYVVGTRLNCLFLSRQFKQVPITYVFIKK